MTVNLYDNVICDNGLYASIDGGGTVEDLVYTENTSLNTVTFDLEMHMPCDMDTSLIHDMSIMFCNADGDVICYGFPFKFACSLDCDDRNLPRSSALKDRESEIRIFPNPASNILMIDNIYDTEEDGTIEIFDQIGRRIHVQRWTDNYTTIDLQGYNSGLYIVRIVNNKGILRKLDKILIVK